MAGEPHSAKALLERLRDAGSDGEDGKAQEASVSALLDIFGDRTHGPLLALPALIGITPIGGIPGVPTILALLIALIALQVAWGAEHIWLPKVARNRELDTDKLTRTAKKLEPVADFLDRWFPGRFSVLVQAPAIRIGAVLTLALCAAVPPLEIVPFAVAIPFGAIALFGLAMVIKDGLLMLLAMAAGTAAALFIGDLLL